jgi:hypothetical protein
LPVRLIHKARAWGMIHCIDKLIEQIDVPFATRLDLGIPLQVFFPFWILDSDFWILYF